MDITEAEVRRSIEALAGFWSDHVEDEPLRPEIVEPVSTLDGLDPVDVARSIAGLDPLVIAKALAALAQALTAAGMHELAKRSDQDAP